MMDLVFESVHSDDVRQHKDTKISQDGAVDWTYVTVDFKAAEERVLAELRERIR